jgi:flagellar hook protein FlgE
MMRSMFSGVTGLKNHQTRMDVIGNNIANVNTVGFKKSRVTFQDTLSQTMRGASSPQDNRGGTNPMQIGLGMTIAAIDTIHTPSSLESTGSMTDLAIEGDGYFIVGDGQDWFYTRAGNFGFDEMGNFVNSAGLKVMGWQDKENYEIPTDTSPQNIADIQITKGLMMPAKTTDEVRFDKNLDAATEKDGAYTLPFKVYDSLGNEHVIKAEFKKGETDIDNKITTWTCSFILEDGVEIEENGPIELTFNEDGKLEEACKTKMENGVKTSPYNIEFKPNNGAGDFEFLLDFDAITQYKKETTIDMTYQSGYAAGSLLGVTTDTRGVITGTFDNGQNKELAQVALANFNNPGALIKGGQNLYRASNNSGEPQIGKAGTAGRGPIAPGSLEMSNVDLSEEFTSMIITQRGFQANSRIITASDEMLQELVNLKR